MNYKIIIIAFIIVILVAILIGRFGRNPKYDIDEAEFEALMKEPDAVILDVRTANEFSKEKIRGAFLIDAENPNFAEQVKRFNKSKTFLIYCLTGSKGARACEIMAELGFEKLYNLKNGIKGWKKKNKPVVN